MSVQKPEVSIDRWSASVNTHAQQIATLNRPPWLRPAVSRTSGDVQQQLVGDSPECCLVGPDHVGSTQTIRLSLRGKAVVLMGKHTMMRKAIRGHLENNASLEKLLPRIKGNVGFVFTKEDLAEVRDLLLNNKVPASARAGAIAPCDVTVPLWVSPQRSQREPLRGGV
ncbi:60S acidic ribosomal protein P0-like [Pseudoliparis swirei]|uniref:60S acidic ribosomal protein P0-like n=1 Tax=Pseudoliparis swirei TaxID=2059687 RepID=UPI0024BDD866|nr:60S acidic ribosomal protein P0-like [Pseudoliparis swirei]